MTTVSRRGFVVGAAGLGLLAGCGRLPWQAEQPTKVPRVGILSPLRSDDAGIAAVRQGLHDLGYVEGENITVEVRAENGQPELSPVLAAELVHLPVDIIVTAAAPGVLAIRQASDSVPVVFAYAIDPIGRGLVESFARPGGNNTGLSNLQEGLAGKRLEFLKLALPGLTRVAAIGGSTLLSDFQETERAAGKLGVQLQFIEVASPEDVEMAFEVASREGVEALMMLASPVLSTRQPQSAELATARRLAAISDQAAFARAGGLMAYGPNRDAQWRRAAYYVDKIIKGAKPADLPVEQPMTFDFVVNMKTARELGITFPNEIMLQVTEVIQ